MRYKVWRSNKDKRLHLLCPEGVEAFEALPAVVRGMGPGPAARRVRSIGYVFHFV
jgi:hypothetical protein